MRKVGIQGLRNNLAKYVRLAASGETIAIIERNRIVAQLTPPETDLRKMSHEERWAEMIHRGIVTPATRKGQGPPPRHPIISFEQLMKDLDEDREDRW